MNYRRLLQPRYALRRAVMEVGHLARLTGGQWLLDALSPPADPYAVWRFHHDLRPHERRDIAAVISQMRVLPRFSVCMPVCDPPLRYLHEAVLSIRDQLYPAWQLCIADDASTDPGVQDALREFEADDRVSVVRLPRRMGISAATNAAAARADGEFLAFVDHDDTIAPQALYRFALTVAGDDSVDLIYSDEDKLGAETGARYDPYFKPDWSPETLLSKMYVGHLLAIRRSLFEGVAGFRSAFDGSQDYDLVLRASESARTIVHVPDVLYHWRAHAQSTAAGADVKPYATAAAEHAVRAALERRGELARIESAGSSGRFIVRYVADRDAAVRIIIPTRDRPALLERCLRSIFERSSHPSFAVTVIDNDSRDPRTLRILDRWSTREPVRFSVRADRRPFNFSALNNAAVAASCEPLLVFLNNDTEVRSRDWLDDLAGYAQRPAIGAVGARLTYRDGRVQHAGVIMGLGGLAGHGFKRLRPDDPRWFESLGTVSNYSAVTAACMMIRRNVFDAIGGFDEALPVAWNDVDLCRRLLQHGYRNVYLPMVHLMHDESASRGKPRSRAAQQRAHEEVTVLRSRWQIDERGDPYYSPWLTLAREDVTLGP